jgi:phosphoribosylformylglycinamidine synthase
MGKACEAFATPVTGGNVSFYNQSSDEGPVFPTPTIGMLGILEDKNNAMTLAFQKAGDLIYMIGDAQNDIASSEYLYSFHNVKLSPAPHFNLEEEVKLQDAIREVIAQKLVQSAHDVADGGLYIALLESGMPKELGFDIETDKNFRKDAYLFGESQSRVVVSVSPEQQAAFEQALQNKGVNFTNLGKVTAHDCHIDGELFHAVTVAKKHYDTALEQILD